MFSGVDYTFESEDNIVRVNFWSEMHFLKKESRTATYCSVYVNPGGDYQVIAEGSTECGKNDVYDPVVGMKISFGRALKNADLDKPERDFFLGEFEKMVEIFQHKSKKVKKDLLKKTGGLRSKEYGVSVTSDLPYQYYIDGTPTIIQNLPPHLFELVSAFDYIVSELEAI